ncbi:MAG: hypothetical protein ABSE73_22080 [Planctomycetota bacterium]
MSDAEQTPPMGLARPANLGLICVAKPSFWRRKSMLIALAAVGALPVGSVAGLWIRSGEVTKLEDERTLLKVDFEAKRKACEDAQAKLSQITQELEQVRKKLAIAQAAVESLTNELTDLKAAAKKQAPAQPDDAERQRLATAAAAAQKDLQQQLNTEREAHKKAEQRLAALQDEIKKAVPAKPGDDAAKHDKALQDQIKKLTTDKTNDDKQVTDLQAKLKKTQDSLDADEKEIKTLKAELQKRKR